MHWREYVGTLMKGGLSCTPRCLHGCPFLQYRATQSCELFSASKTLYAPCSVHASALGRRCAIQNDRTSKGRQIGCKSLQFDVASKNPISPCSCLVATSSSRRYAGANSRRSPNHLLPDELGSASGLSLQAK